MSDSDSSHSSRWGTVPLPADPPDPHPALHSGAAPAEGHFTSTGGGGGGGGGGVLRELSESNRNFRTMEWLSTVVWDDEVGAERPPLTQLVLDPNDPCMIFEVDVRSKEEIERALNKGNEPAPPRDPFTFLSNDRFYRKGKTYLSIKGKVKVRHSLVAENFHDPRNGLVIRPYLTLRELSHFHRPLLEPAALGLNAQFHRLVTSAALPLPEMASSPGALQNVTLYRPRDGTWGSFLESAGELQMLRMGKRKQVKKLSELCAREGRVVLLEYIEQRPAILVNAGMSSLLVTYYRQKALQDEFEPELEDFHGSLRVLKPRDPSPLPLGDIAPGSVLTVLHTNLFVAPVFRHAPAHTDFLLVRDRRHGSWHINVFPSTYVVGQLQANVEVPAPSSKEAKDIRKKRYLSFIYRHMLRGGNPFKIALQDLMDTFRDQTKDASLRGLLKTIAVQTREEEAAGRGGVWLLRDDKPMPPEENIQQMCTPDDVTILECSQAARQHLEDLGLKDALSMQPSAILAALPTLSSPSLREAALFVEEQLQLTAWNWTRHFVRTVAEQGMIKIFGPGNPLARGQGFCFLSYGPKKEEEVKDEKKAAALAAQGKMSGTANDLRKLSMAQSQAILTSLGYSALEIKGMKRWARIHVIAAAAQQENSRDDLARFYRKSRNSAAQVMSHYKSEVQRVLERQSQILSSLADPFSFPEDKASEEELAEEAERRHGPAKPEDRDRDREATGKEAKSQKSREDDEEAEYLRFQRERRERQMALTQPQPQQDDAAAKPPARAAEEKKKDAKPKYVCRNGRWYERKTKTVSAVKRILTYGNADGSTSRKEILITDPHLVQLFQEDLVDGGARSVTSRFCSSPLRLALLSSPCLPLSLSLPPHVCALGCFLSALPPPRFVRALLAVDGLQIRNRSSRPSLGHQRVHGGFDEVHSHPESSLLCE